MALQTSQLVKYETDDEDDVSVVCGGGLFQAINL